MKHQHTSRLLTKALSVTLSATLLLSMAVVGNVFGTTAFAAEAQTEGDYTYVVLDNDTAQITKYNGTQADVTVPATLGGKDVSEIGSRAFENNDELTSIAFPTSVKTIGDHAFFSCDLLENVDFGSGVTTIGPWCFEQCRALQSVEVPANVKKLDSRAFSSCPILTTVKLNEGLEYMGDRVFAGAPVSEIYIPLTVTYANETFAEAELLETVNFAEGITAIPNDMFEDCNSIRQLTIPDTVTRLGNDSLCQMRSLESIVIPDSVTEWGTYVLYECDKLTNVTIGKGVTNIPDNAFGHCVSLKEITIPDNVTTIGNASFKDCSKLEKVTLSKNLEDVGSYSFERTAIKELTLPASVKKGNYSFFNCTSLKTVHFDEGYTTFVTGMFRNTGIESITIPEGVTELPGELFKDCQKLTTVELPSTLRTIGYNAFDSCPVLDNVDIPESVKRIDSGAFAGTTSLKTFTLHEGIQTMNYGIFRDSALTSVYIPKTLSATDAPFTGSNITDVTFSDGIATLNDKLFAYAGKLTHLEIPETVIKIGNECFRGSNIESMIIPDSVKTIGKSAFSECGNLYAVGFGAGVRKLPEYCFYGCPVLQNVVIPETVVDLENGVFERSGISYQRLPQSIHSIPAHAFKDCANLTEVACSAQLESIGDYAFERCYNFTTLNTPVDDIAFNNTTFKDCPKFTDKRFYVFNPENTGIESTGNIGVDHTLVHFTVKYDIRDDWDDADIEMQRLYLNLPDNLEIIPASFDAEGFAFDGSTYTGDYKSFDLAGAATKGTLHFSGYLNSSNAAVKNVSAEVEFRHKGTGFRKPLGEVQFTTAKLSLFAPTKLTDTALTVSGYSVSADKEVKIVIARLNKEGAREEAVTHTVTPNKYTGKYISEPLSIMPEGKVAVNGDKFEVYAECDGAKSDVSTFIYAPGALKIVKATETVNITKFIAPHETNLSHGNQANTYDITGIFTKGVSPVVSINPAEMLKFEFDFENDENICAMVLMSHKGDEWKFMQLFYDAETDKWIGEGYFNILDHELVPGQTYVPGALNLFWLYGERKDTYKSEFYGEPGKDTEPVGGPDWFGDITKKEVFYYDADGKPHGDLGDYHETARDTVINILIDIVKGDWTDAGSEAVTGGLHTLWQWGNENDNFFSFTHGGVRIGPDGLPILPGDGGDVYNHNSDKDGKQRNAIDPSGVVYEAVKGNPVEGATATIEKFNEETKEWEAWNAADYEQENPLLTNNEGAYAWMTDEGTFRVTVSKEGYETQTSEAFDIPPEKLGLDFSLVDTTTHATATITADEATGGYLLKFSKFMKPETVTTETVVIDGMDDVTITPVYLNEGDEFADTYAITGKTTKAQITFNVTDGAQSYSGVTAEPTTETVDAGIIGDVNGDGKVDVTDATLLQQYLAEMAELSPAQLAVADTNGDGKIDVTDATAIQNYIAELIDHLGA